MVNSEFQNIISDLAGLSIRLASLDVPAFSQALKICRAQSCLSGASSYLSRVLIELTNQKLPNFHCQSHTFTPSGPNDDDNLPF